jgi:hypothetical protein
MSDMRRPNDLFLDWAGHAPQWQLLIVSGLFFGSVSTVLIYTESGKSGAFAIVVGFIGGAFFALFLALSIWIKDRAELSRRPSPEDRI